MFNLIGEEPENISTPLEILTSLQRVTFPKDDFTTIVPNFKVKQI